MCSDDYQAIANKPPWFNKEFSHLRNVKSRLYTNFEAQVFSLPF